MVGMMGMMTIRRKMARMVRTRRRRPMVWTNMSVTHTVSRYGVDWRHLVLLDQKGSFHSLWRGLVVAPLLFNPGSLHRRIMTLDGSSWAVVTVSSHNRRRVIGVVSAFEVLAFDCLGFVGRWSWKNRASWRRSQWLFFLLFFFCIRQRSINLVVMPSEQFCHGHRCHDGHAIILVDSRDGGSSSILRWLFWFTMFTILTIGTFAVISTFDRILEAFAIFLETKRSLALASELVDTSGRHTSRRWCRGCGLRTTEDRRRISRGPRTLFDDRRKIMRRRWGRNPRSVGM